MSVVVIVGLKRAPANYSCFLFRNKLHISFQYIPVMVIKHTIDMLYTASIPCKVNSAVQAHGPTFIVRYVLV